MSTDVPEKPMRRDAARSRARIVEAAAELFAEHGLSPTLNEIARHAGVGVGTVYRHFPDREELIGQLLENRVDELVAIVEAGLADPDPWHGMISALERGLEMQASNRGLRELIHETGGAARVGIAREKLLPGITALLTRAQQVGAIRPDIRPSDVPLIQLMLVSLMDASRDVDPSLWRRYLALLLRGMATVPDELGPLPVSAIAVEDVDRVMSAAAPPPR